MIDPACISVMKYNATSCDGQMSHRIADLSADTNYTALLTVWNPGGHSDESRVTAVTHPASGQLVDLAAEAAKAELQNVRVEPYFFRATTTKYPSRVARAAKIFQIVLLNCP